MIHHQDDTVQIHHGDCLDVLRTLPDCSVDAVVCDPPYGLANTTPAQVAETITAWVSGDREHLPTGKGFMGKSWDAFVPPVAVWDECLRVLKPGGHALVFAGSRTHDLMTLGLRLAGFDIRDTISWLYGSGFPKSLDIGKAIDKQANAAPVFDAIRAHIREWRDRADMSNAQLNAALGLEINGCGMARHWTSEKGGQHSIPSKEQWVNLKRVLGWPDCEFDGIYGAVKDGAERPVLGTASLPARPGFAGETYGEVGNKVVSLTAPATPAAQQWQGWGSALKPAFEPIVVARKPLTGTLAANVLQWGTGGLNIDGTRVATTDEVVMTHSRSNAASDAHTVWENPLGPSERHQTPGQTLGRWPTNVALDADMAEALDEESGVSKSPSVPVRQGGNRRHDVGLSGNSREGFGIGYGDSGGASRFFPTFRDEPNFNVACGATVGDNYGPCDLRLGHDGWHDDGEGTEWDEVSGGPDRSQDAPALPTFRYQAKAPTRERPSYIDANGVKQAHSTVKPLELMRWLVRLVTPPGGTILEPFAGSGTTVEAAILEGFRCIAVEREADYLPLIMARLERARPEPLASDVSEGEPVLFDKPQGRWPTNVVMDRSTATALDAEGPHTKDGVAVRRNAKGGGYQAPSTYGKFADVPLPDIGHGGEGGPSRFFPVFDEDAYEDRALTQLDEGLLTGGPLTLFDDEDGDVA